MLDVEAQEKWLNKIVNANDPMKKPKQFVYPNLTFDNKNESLFGGRQVFCVPEQAHTSGDIFINIPSEYLLLQVTCQNKGTTWETDIPLNGQKLMPEF